MTTIAASARLGVMASDSHWHDGDSKGPVRKVWRIRGRLVGFAGGLGDIERVKAWMRGGEKGKPAGVESVSALELTASGLRCWTIHDGWQPVPDVYAIGSGGKAARGALLAGATPQRAVDIAREIDAGTSGRTRVYKLKQRP